MTLYKYLCSVKEQNSVFTILFSLCFNSELQYSTVLIIFVAVPKLDV